MSIKALRKAIDRAGGQTALATLIGKTQGHVSKWLEREYVPAECVIPIERATGIPRHELRPDLYPATPDQVRATQHGVGFMSRRAFSFKAKGAAS